MAPVFVVWQDPRGHIAFASGARYTSRMSTQPSPSVSRDYRFAVRALALVCVSVVLGWMLFVISVYVGEFGSADSQAFVGDIAQATGPRFTALWVFAAIAVVGLGSLVASRATAQVLGRSPGLGIARSVRVLSFSMLITAAALSALAAIALFLSNFSSFGGDGQGAFAQLFDVYLPIVLHTALVVTLILAGFVFVEPAAKVVHTDFAQEARLAADPALAVAGKRDVALGFTLPIVITCAALLVGLILTDLVPTIPSAWVWVIVIAGAGLGILLGTRSASHAVHAAPAPNAAVGAHVLNLVLAIVLAVVAGVSSLGFGGGAVSSLRAAPSLSINLSVDGTSTPESFSVWGSDLRQGSTVALVKQPDDEVIATGTTDSNGWLSIDAPIDEPLTAGKHTLNASAEGRDGRELRLNFVFSIAEDGTTAPGSALDASENLDSNSTGVTTSWLGRELLPALLLILLAVGTLAFSIRLREPRPAAANPGAYAVAPAAE